MGSKSSREVLRATHAGEIKIGEVTLPCAVLEDGTRVISQRGMSESLGRARTGSGNQYSNLKSGVSQIPYFLAGKNLKSFIDNDLVVSLSSPVEYTPIRGGKSAKGFPAAIVPQICEVWLKARDAGVLTSRQFQSAERAYILIRGLATVGIVALVDEATGYQEIRNKDDLAKILEAYINEELRPWVKTFPNELFKQIYRLNKWKYDPDSSARNQQVGHWINKYIYEVLPPGVLEKLQRKNPRQENGHRRTKHHQSLTAEIGCEHLERVLIKVTTILQVSQTKREFRENFHRIFHPSEPQQKRLFENRSDE